MEEIYNKIPCRRTQLNDLLDLFGDHDEPLPYSLFICGNMATGKSLCVETILRHLGYKHVIINCIECYTPKIIYESILTVLDEECGEIKCDSMIDFVNNLNRIKSISDAYEPYVLVLDKAERLRNMDQSVMSAFLKLRELCALNICTVFITHIVYENFYFNTSVRDPIKLFFPNYNKKEFFDIIFLHQESFVRRILNARNVDKHISKQLLDPDLFACFLNAFLSVFYRPCRDLIELLYMARENFNKYCEPIIEHKISAHNRNKLWHHISPILKSYLNQLYLRITYDKNQQATQSTNKENNTEQTNYILDNTLREELTCTKTFTKSFELPYYTKYILIAAYIASYNPPKEDKRLFMKNHGKQRKNLQQVKSKFKICEKSNTKLGPKDFTLDRLLAIFFSILEDNIGLRSYLLVQIATLENLKLIAGSKDIHLDNPKYKCIVGYDFILAVAETVGFNIKKYLYDFI